MRIAFAGTPPFAANALAALIEAGHDIALVLTQPDRPSGRGMKLKPSAVKELALKHDLPVITPLTLSIKRNPEEAEQALKTLEDADVDVLIVAAYGLILPQRALDAAKGIGETGEIRSMNIHASILPRWRGAAPIQRAIIAGDAQTGVTLMKMEAGLDTGPMIEIGTTPISETDTTVTLTDRLGTLGAQMVVEALSHPDTLKCTVQPEEGVTYAEKILKTESAVDWTMSAVEIDRRVRAFNPFPFVTAARNGEIFKIREAKAVEGYGKPGEVLVADKKLVIACGEGALECTKLQKAGKPEMPVASFLQSFEIVQGEVLS
ncbi:MAG: methionyl-tRNA formyltransferase [Sutterellaceae bacterium]|nr:methionyl-tRNA formyltransferase [Sutterellaceae bacterium]